MSVPSLESLIAQHRYVSDMVSPTRDCTCGFISGIGSPAEHAAHVAEVIRQHHAVVELPPPNADEREWETSRTWCSASEGSVGVTVLADRLTPSCARRFASHLLAAADGAEDHQ